MKRNKEFKLGAVLHVKYRAPKNDTRDSFGIVIKESDRILYLGHNFRGIRPIDTTRIMFGDIIKVEEIYPKEINTPEEIVEML